MIRKEHIEKIQLLGRMLGTGAHSIPATAVNAGIEYAQRLTTDAALQADVKAAFKPDLAERDLKRAAQVLEKYGEKPAAEIIQPTDNEIMEACFGPSDPEHLAATLAMFESAEPVTLEPAIEELPLPPFSNKLTSDDYVRYGILDKQGHWTPRGRAWRDAGLGKQNEPKPAPVTPTPVRPIVKRNPLERGWEQTDEGFRALELYVKTNRDNPPDMLDLKAWYEAQQ